MMENIEVYVTAIGTIALVTTMVWKTNDKLGTVWKRFDEYKKHLEETHVSKEVCNILHNQIVEDVVEIKSDVKKLLLMAKNGNK
jgi:hypothetical protein